MPLRNELNKIFVIFFVILAIPALQSIIYDLYVLRTAGKSDGGQGLETQREVVLSMLLRLVHYPEVCTRGSGDQLVNTDC